MGRSAALAGLGLALSLLFSLSYRLVLFQDAAVVYSQASLWSLAGVVMAGFPTDFLVAAFIGGLSFGLALVFHRRLRIAHVFVLLLPAAQVPVQVIGLYYFRAFEKPYEPTMMGEGLSSFWKQALLSLIHDVPLTLHAYGGLLLLLVVLVGLGSHRFELPRRTAAGFTRKHALAALGILSVLLPIVLVGPALARTTSADGPPPGLRTHPVLLLLATAEPGAHTSEDIRTGALSFDGRALTRSVMHPRVSVARGKRRNVVFYFFESTAARYVGLRHNGRPVTPNWDRLRAHAFDASNHYANFPLTVCSLVTVLSSVHDLPTKEWIPYWKPDLPLPALTEVLHEAGYRTAFVQNLDLDSFSHRRYLRNRKIDLLMDGSHVDRSGLKSYFKGIDDRVLLRPVLEFATRRSDRPFFLAFSPDSPHHPYLIPDRRFAITDPSIARNRKEQIYLQYLNSLHFADYVLGEFVAGLDRAGILDDTLLFVFGDHGEAFYQHPNNYLHSIYLYEENVRVPFLIYNRELFRAPYVYRGVSSHVDLAPTLLDLLAIRKPPHYQGVSLLAPHRERAAVLHAHWGDEFIGLRDGKWKYILRPKDGRQELYDLEADPDERRNLAATRSSVAQSLRASTLAAKQHKVAFFRKVKALPARGDRRLAGP